MGGILLFAEKDNLAFDLAPKALEIAKGTNTELSALVLGPNAQARAAKYFAFGVTKVYMNDIDINAVFDCKMSADILAQAAKTSQADVIMCSSSKRGRVVAAQLSQILGAGCATNVLDIKIVNGQPVTVRYGLGGATMITEQMESAKKVIAILPSRFENTAATVAGQVIPIELKAEKSAIQMVEKTERKREAVDIENAKILVCVGKGLKKKEDLSIIQEIATLVKGEVGCTREISSTLGWLAEDRLVGMSGKRCKPTLVFSLGISGQNQYTAGILGAKVSIAVNTDPNAPIFKVTDYGIADDIYKVMPKLIEKLKQIKA
ncbi:MAG TPA: electron transfer flavoprotein subunit alpha/FixB family protein [Dehalococcoidales bacterium]|nr:electron transfer flavoprotein subunit alpha/FixB family protein [Dehalococcoidales bacterium]